MQTKIRQWMVGRLPGLGWIICSLAAFFYCYEYMLRIEPSVMVEPLMHDFAVTAGGLGFLVALYYYAYTPLQAVVGVLTDYFGARKVLLSAVVSCAVGAWVFGQSSDVYLAGLGRLLIGVGSAFAFVGVLKLASEWLPMQYFAIFAGITTSLGMLGGMLGDVELSKMVQSYGWHFVMMLSVVVGVVLFALFWLFVHNKKDGDTARLASRRSWRYFAVGFVRMFTNKQLWLTGLVGCVLYTSLTVVAEMWGIPFLKALTQQDKMVAAHLNSMIFFGWLVGSPFTGWFSNHLGSRKIPMILGCVFSCVLMLSLLVFQPQSNLALAVMLFLLGVFSSAEILVFVIARELVSDSLVATAIGFINLLVMLGGMLVQPLVGKLLDMGWQGTVKAGVHIYPLQAYTHALYIVPALLVVATGMACCLKESYRD